MNLRFAQTHSIPVEHGAGPMAPRCVWGLFLALGLLLLATALTWQVNAAPPADPPPPAWTIVSSPNAGEPTQLRAVAARASNDVWAVGYHFDPTIPPPSPTPSSTFIQHWDGTAWTSVSAPNPGNRNELNGVAVRAANDAWAVGGSNTTYSGGNWQALILHWNGSLWSEMVRPPLSNNVLYGVTVLDANNAWAVGTWSLSPTQPGIFHWNGSEWSTVYAPTSYSYGGYLYGVTARTASDVWAVGYENTNATTAIPLTVHWDGTSWQKVPSLTAVTGVHSLVRQVASVAANNVWAVGQTTDSSNNVSPLTIHWDGSSWSTVAQAGGSPKLLLGVTALGTNDLWEVGANNTSGTPATLIVHWNGSTLSDQTSPNQPGENELYGVAAVAADDIWAVGRSNAGINQFQTLTLHYTTSTPTPTPTDTPFPLPPQYTKSYYIQSNSITNSQQLGCSARRRQEVGLVVLNFGSPRINSEQNPRYGTKPLNINTFFDTNQIRNLALAFADGYAHPENCPGPEPLIIAPKLVIGIGVSNSARRDNSNRIWLDNQDLREEHGAAWAQLANDVNSTLDDKKLYPDISAVAGYDAEYYGALFADCRNQTTGRRGPCPNPNPVGTPIAVDEWTRYTPAPDYGTKQWADGYNAQAVQYPKPIPLYNFGSCEDCPRTQDPSTWNANTITRTVLQRVTYLNWDLFTAEPVPQIYFEPRAYEWYNVRWWYKVERNAYMYVYGSMTQCGDAGCLGLNSTTRLQPRFDEACQPSTPCIGDWVPFNCLTNPCPNLPPHPGWQALVDMLSSRHTPERTPNPDLYPQPRMPFEPTDIICQIPAAC